jgi:hypothetical protein
MIRWVENRLQVDRNRIESLFGEDLRNSIALWSSISKWDGYPWCVLSSHSLVQNYFWHQDYLYLHFSSNHTHKTKTGTANRWETTDSHPPGSIKLSGQPIAGVSFCCGFYHSTWAAPTWIKLFFILSNFWKIISPPCWKFQIFRIEGN